MSELHQAILANDIKLVMYLLSNPGRSPNELNEEGKTPLMLAFEQQRWEIAVALLAFDGAFLICAEKGVDYAADDVSITLENKLNSLSKAVEQGSAPTPIKEYLLSTIVREKASLCEQLILDNWTKEVFLKSAKQYQLAINIMAALPNQTKLCKDRCFIFSKDLVNLMEPETSRDLAPNQDFNKDMAAATKQAIFYAEKLLEIESDEDERVKLKMDIAKFCEFSFNNFFWLSWKNELQKALLKGVETLLSIEEKHYSQYPLFFSELSGLFTRYMEVLSESLSDLEMMAFSFLSGVFASAEDDFSNESSSSYTHFILTMDSPIYHQAHHHEYLFKLMDQMTGFLLKVVHLDTYPNLRFKVYLENTANRSFFEENRNKIQEATSLQTSLSFSPAMVVAMTQAITHLQRQVQRLEQKTVDPQQTDVAHTLASFASLSTFFPAANSQSVKRLHDNLEIYEQEEDKRVNKKIRI